jgi:hypothetical protein
VPRKPDSTITELDVTINDMCALWSARLHNERAIPVMLIAVTAAGRMLVLADEARPRDVVDMLEEGIAILRERGFTPL